MFYFNVYFRSFIGKIVYKSALAGFTMRFAHTEHDTMVFCGVCSFIYIKDVDKKEQTMKLGTIMTMLGMGL